MFVKFMYFFKNMSKFWRKNLLKKSAELPKLARVRCPTVLPTALQYPGCNAAGLQPSSPQSFNSEYIKMRGGSGGRDSNRAAEAATGRHRLENFLAPAAASQPAESSKIDENHQKSMKIIKNR